MTQSRAVDLTDNLCTKQGNVGLKSGVYNQDQFQIKSGFKSREGYNGMCMVFMKPKNCYNSLLKFERNKAGFAFQILADANISCDHLSSFYCTSIQGFDYAINFWLSIILSTTVKLQPGACLF